MKNRRIITDYHNNQSNNYSNYNNIHNNNNNCYASTQMTTTTMTPSQHPPPSSSHSSIYSNSDLLSPKWPPSSYPPSMQESPTPQKFHSTYFSNPCKISTDFRGIPQQPGPSSMPEQQQKYSPREKAARSAAIAAIWKNGLPKNTKFYTLKNQHILIFARHYFKTDEDPMKSNKDEYNQYYPNVMARYFPKAASLRLRLVKLKNATQESNEMTVLGFDKDIEAGILELKNILEAETRHFFKDDPKPVIPISMQHVPIQKKLSQFDAKVEEIPFPPQFRIQSSTSGTPTTPTVTEFQSHQRQFDIKTESSSVSSSLQHRKQQQQQNGGIKTYHSFTILPKNRLSNINIRQRRYKSQDEVNPEVIPITPQTPQRTNFTLGNSPDVYIVDEKIAVRCPSAEVAASASFNHSIQHHHQQQQQQQILMHRTPAPDPWQPYPLPTSTQSTSTPYIPQRSSFIQPQQQQCPPLPSSSSIGNYPIPDPYAFDFPASPINQQEWKIQSCEDLLNEIKSEAAMFEKETAKAAPISISRNSTSNNLDQNKPQQIRGTKRRESGRTFCNGAKAIVSYFSLDGDTASVAKQQRRTASPFSELNASTIPALTAMP